MPETELGAAGRHPDPETAGAAAPDPAGWPKGWREAFGSPFMDVFRRGLRYRGRSVRDSVLDDLATYFAIPPDQALEHCLDWERESVAEWEAAPRDDPAGITDFYRTTRSWCFDLLWYAYLQASGFAYPSSVDIARSLRDRPVDGPALDFGSGAGVTAQLVAALGRPVTLADISATLLDFAGFRLRRRDLELPAIDLTRRGLDAGAYGVITAIDTLAHVPDVPATLQMLHRALRPDGVLFTNLDVRQPSAETAWHLYADESPLRLELHRAGFRAVQTLEWGMVRYRRVDPSRGGEWVWRLGQTVRSRTPVGHALSRLR